MEDRVFIFSKEEFMVLAAASGIRQMYGFAIGEEIEEQKAVLTMQRLAEKGLLLSIDGAFQIQEPAASLFLQIKDAKTTIEIHKRSGRSCIVYIGERGVKVAASQRRRGMLEVQGISTKDLWRFLTEEGWIPEEKEEFL